jgi:Flp pilus assembly protein TadG
MPMSPFSRSAARGQILVLFTLSLVVLLLGAGLVVDGGYAFSQNRKAQNAADFAAMAGTRIVGEALTGIPAGAGIAANVEDAVTSILAANNAQLVSAQYVNKAGVTLGNVVGASVIPPGTNGVVVNASTTWRPFFLGVMGVNSWSAGSTATALTPGSREGGGVLPVGLQADVYNNLTPCPVTSIAPCVSALTNSLTSPGGFGWLAFGVQGQGNKCNWNSLGMDRLLFRTWRRIHDRCDRGR